MRRALILGAAVCSIALVGPVRAQAPVNPQAAQIASLRKELQRQRNSQETLRKELQAAREANAGLERQAGKLHEDLDSLRQELARTWTGGIVGLAVLFTLFLLIAFRRPRSSSSPDELQQRLAALDRKLRDLTP